MQFGNLFDDAMPPASGERFDTLLAHRRLVVERIVSSSRIALQPQCQVQDEWVVLVCGNAELEVAGAPVVLKAGDHVFLPAGTPHAVTRVDEGSLWLAVHLHPESSMPAESVPSGVAHDAR